MKTLDKLSPELRKKLVTHKELHLNTDLAYATRIMHEDYPQFDEEMDIQILQYGPDTTVGELLKMATDEKPIPLTWGEVKSGIGRLFGWA